MEKERLLDKIGRKQAITMGAVFFGLILIITIAFFIFTAGKVLVDVEFAPFAATVKLDDTTIMNHHGNYITPGEYHLTVEFENFNTYEEDVTVDADTKYLFGKLIPANEEGMAYMREHNEEFLQVEGVAGKIAAEEGQKQKEQYPIITRLPIKDPYYTLGYTFGDDGVLSITVEAALAYRQLATTKLMEMLSADELAEYDILFYDLDNPFAEKFVENKETDPAKYIRQGFSGVGIDFEVNGGVEEGDYYYAYLRYQFRKFVNVVYRVVLIRDDGAWKLAADPYPLLTTTNTPGVPAEILYKVNKL